MKVDNFYFSWHHNLDSTECYAFRDPPKGSLRDIKPTVIGVSRLNPNDHYDHQIGRKVSLTKALQELTKKKLIDKEFKLKVWEAYRTMTKEPRWQLKSEANAA